MCACNPCMLLLCYCLIVFAYSLSFAVFKREGRMLPSYRPVKIMLPIFLHLVISTSRSAMLDLYGCTVQCVVIFFLSCFDLGEN